MLEQPSWLVVIANLEKGGWPAVWMGAYLQVGEIYRLPKHRDAGWQLNVLQQLWRGDSAPLKSHLHKIRSQSV